MSVIRTQNLSKRYGRRRGIDSVAFDVSEGEIFGFLGPNGSGKSTTIRVLLGFLRPNGGEASLFGLDCWSRSHEIKRDVGYVPGDLRLVPACRHASYGRVEPAASAALALRQSLDNLNERFNDPDYKPHGYQRRSGNRTVWLQPDRRRLTASSSFESR